jgi:hypothetical protein
MINEFRMSDAGRDAIGTNMARDVIVTESMVREIPHSRMGPIEDSGRPR